MRTTLSSLTKMFAMQLQTHRSPLVPVTLPTPQPGAGEVLVRVEACGVCRTDLHVIDAELPNPRLPIVPGHQIVGRVTVLGAGVTELGVGQRVGVPWLGSTCGACEYCTTLHAENLCDHPTFTGFTRDGGFASMAVADARFAFPLPDDGDAVSLAPLLCAGLIGWRALRKAGEGKKIGLYGVGSAGSIMIQVIKAQGREAYAFPSPGDTAKMEFARRLGAAWAGGSDEKPPTPLDAAIIFAPAGKLVPIALKAVRKGGRVVCAGIHMSPIPQFSYDDLWEEREIVSVANLTREDGEFLQIAPKMGVKTETAVYELKDVNAALDDLRHGRFNGSAVVVPPRE